MRFAYINGSARINIIQKSEIISHLKLYYKITDNTCKMYAYIDLTNSYPTIDATNDYVTNSAFTCIESQDDISTMTEIQMT